jgi:hypothetical protein
VADLLGRLREAGAHEQAALLHATIVAGTSTMEHTDGFTDAIRAKASG